MEQLDTLQRELNRTLEQIGHVFAAPDDKSLTAAATKLKYTLPKAQGSFQVALDQLSNQIERAQLVLRRDLALQTEALKPAAAVPIPDPTPAPVTTEVMSSPAAKANPTIEVPHAEEAKDEPAPPQPDEPEVPIVPEAQDTDFDMLDLDAGDQPSADQSTGEDQPTFNSQPIDQPTLDSQPNDPPDNDDNISALLPGLQDYANNQPEGLAEGLGEGSGDPDFDDIFGNMDMPEAGEGGDAGAGMECMDSFLDFDFGADFGGGNGGDGGDRGMGSGNLEDEVDFFKFD